MEKRIQELELQVLKLTEAVNKIAETLKAQQKFNADVITILRKT